MQLHIGLMRLDGLERSQNLILELVEALMMPASEEMFVLLFSPGNNAAGWVYIVVHGHTCETTTYLTTQ